MGKFRIGIFQNFRSATVILFLTVFFIKSAIAADNTTIKGTSSSPANYNSASTWSLGHVPTSTENIIIDHVITRPSNLSYQWATQTITINSGGSLTINGNLTIEGSGEAFTINGGTLIVTGSITIDNGGATLTVSSGSLTANTLNVNYGSTVTVSSGASATVSALNTGNNSTAILNNNGTITVNGDVSSSGVITNMGTMQVNGSLTQANTGNKFENYGNVKVTVDATANGLIQLYPGTSANSEFVVVGNLTVNSNPWLVVGTDVSSCGSAITYYADAVIDGNLVLTGSGDVTVKQNGRLVVFGNIDGTAGTGGNLVTINCGGQAYVNGNLKLTTGGGSTITNSNSSSSPTGSDGNPVIGLYVNGTTTAQTTTGTVSTKAKLQTNDLTFYNYISSLSGSPLPITLVSFRVNDSHANSIELTWSTSFEKNFDKFVIERSNDGITFQSVGEIKGAGNSKILLTYNFTDNSPYSGVNYYRLKSIDLDNSFEYSKTIFTSYEGVKTFSVYPNPSNGESVSYALNFETNDGDMIIVIDYLGVQVASVTVDRSNNSVFFASPLKSGSYIVKYISRDFQQIDRLVVR